MTLVFLCSPHPHGVTDILGKHAAAGAGVCANLIALRDFIIAPCLGCGHCLKNGGTCILAAGDCDKLFALLAGAATVIFAAPVYFYALPGQFKIFIDRSQKFWSNPWSFPEGKKAAVIMAAGRLRGEKLFEGSLLTLRWFLKPFGYKITDTLLLRGLNNPEDIGREERAQAFDLGRYFAANV